MDFDLKFWAGTEECLASYLIAMKRLHEGEPRAAGQVFHSSGAPAAGGQEEELPRLYTRLGDVGVIRIAGPLNNSDRAWRNECMGMTGYPEIRDALVFAANDAKVGGIVLDVASGGGAVSGVFDTSKLIKTIDSKVKPVHAFSSGGVLSGAYLLASSARSITIDQMSEAGSIGVLSVHQEYSKMLKEVGITPTVIRAGKYKTLSNPYEPLTETAKAEVQAQLDQLYGIFVQHVAEERRVTYAVADEKMAQGRVFIGESAKLAGLVDDIGSFDKVVSKVQGGIDSARERSKYGANSTNYNNKGMQVSKALTEQDIAALALGAPVAGDLAAPAAPAAEPQEAAAAAPVQPTVEAPAAPAAAAPAAAEPTALQLLQTQLADSQEKAVELKLQLRAANEANTAMKGSHDAMRAIAVTSVERLRTALGQTPGGADAMADAALLAEHDKLTKAFESKFKAGGLAAVAPADQPQASQAAAVDPHYLARIAATRPTK